jgi:hypothetical protein
MRVPARTDLFPRASTLRTVVSPGFHAGTAPVLHAPKDGFEGFGAEFNPYLYANRPGATAPIQKKVGSLNAHDVRVFVPPEVMSKAKYAASVKTLGQAATDAIVASFYKTVQLAQRNGASLNLTFNGLMSNNAKLDDAAWAAHKAQMVDNVAQVIDALRARNGGAELKGLHVTLDNEVNGTEGFAQAMASGQVATFAGRYAEGYAALDARLNPDGQRHVKLVAGDLVAENRRPFLTAMSQTDIEKHIDAWSLHIYPRFNESPEQAVLRLESARGLADQLHLTKPLTLNELGVKGYGPWELRGGKLVERVGEPGMTQPYTCAVVNGQVVNTPHGVPVESSGRAAFLQGWTALAAARLGFQGAVKWEAFDGGNGPGGYNPGAFAMIGADGKTSPSYSLMRMFADAVPAGWSAVKGSGVSGAERATFFRGPGGGLSALAMNEGHAPMPFKADGFGQDAKVYVARWTPDGRLKYSQAQVINGVVQVSVPPGGSVAVSTVAFQK